MFYESLNGFFRRRKTQLLPRVWTVPLLLAGLAAGTVPLAWAATVSSINVTSIIHDEDTAMPSNQMLLRSDDYNGSWQASYNNTGNATNKMFSTDGWQMYLGNQSLRRIWLTLSKPANNSPLAPAPDGYYYANVEVYSRCYDANNNRTGFLVIPSGMANNRCDLGADFAYGGTKYKLVMGPTVSGTGWTTVSCNGGSGSTCNNWTIVPNTLAGNGNVPTVANLYRFAKNGTLVYIGSYYNTYRIDVTNP